MVKKIEKIHHTVLEYGEIVSKIHDLAAAK